MPQLPNIILLCPDEMKASALGCYGQKQPVSPFIDAWAAHGARFEQCHTVHTKCTPSRTSLVSAQYPHIGGHRTLDLPLRAGEINLLRTLREYGYINALAGKNHVVDAETLPLTFDVRLQSRGRRSLETPPDSAMPAGSYWVGRDAAPLEGFTDHGVTDVALDWIEGAGPNPRDPNKPFFLWLNWAPPHPPYSVPAPFYGALDRNRIKLPPRDRGLNKPPYQARLQQTYGLQGMTDAQWRELVATYLEMCAFIDAETRRFVEHLEHAGLLENSIVIFWSDHGDFAGEHQLVEKWDTSFYDCITRVPFILHAPGRVKAQTVPALVESIDILPTVLELAGVPLPRGIQGRSLVPLLEGRADQGRDLVFCQGGQEPELLQRAAAPDAKPRPSRAYLLKQRALWEEPSINARAKMIRDHNWKYTFRSGGLEELYDLRADPHELLNLAGDAAYREVVERYRLKLIEKLVETETVEPYQNFLES